MAKYKCEDCNHVFEDDLSTMQCPSCGSANIKKAGSGPNINKKWLAICLAALGMIGVIIAIGSGDEKLEASLDENQGIISIMVDGRSLRTVQPYVTEFLEDSCSVSLSRTYIREFIKIERINSANTNTTNTEVAKFNIADADELDDKVLDDLLSYPHTEEEQKIVDSMATTAAPRNRLIDKN